MILQVWISFFYVINRSRLVQERVRLYIPMLWASGSGITMAGNFY